MAKITLLVLFLLSQIFTIHAYAKSQLESEMLLREALMSANADYNQHKKKSLEEEMERAETWIERDEDAIAIGQGLDLATQVEQELREDLIDADLRSPSGSPN